MLVKSKDDLEKSQVILALNEKILAKREKIPDFCQNCLSKNENYQRNYQVNEKNNPVFAVFFWLMGGICKVNGVFTY